MGAGGEGFRLHAGAVTPAQEEVELHLAYRWFCRLDLDGKVPHHSTFSVNRPSASITLASTAKLSPLTRPASMRARTTASNTCRNTSLSRKRPWPAAITVWRPRKPTGRHRSARRALLSSSLRVWTMKTPAPIASRRRWSRFPIRPRRGRRKPTSACSSDDRAQGR